MDNVTIKFIGRKSGALGWGEHITLTADIPDNLEAQSDLEDYVFLEILYVDHEHVRHSSVSLNGKSFTGFFETDYRKGVMQP